MYPQMVPVAAANIFSFPVVTMVFGSLSLLQSLILLHSLGISSTFIKWSDAVLSTIIVNPPLLG